jgi:crotonobetainyl-CoA:carnitine CoA-transferase CaiB-like acyl-CoA transferase
MPVKVSETPGTFRIPPPTVGQHNDETLKMLGYSAEQVKAWKAEGIVGSESDRQRVGGPASW